MLLLPLLMSLLLLLLLLYDIIRNQASHLLTYSGSVPVAVVAVAAFLAQSIPDSSKPATH
jgi:hypothetical protein